ncbi:MAG TPA: hypothetical protein VFC26_09365, partial [Verrucomicrobiae bacterium]|nr:hypothetical protein [Verrucomicrobiae bacterium]
MERKNCGGHPPWHPAADRRRLSRRVGVNLEYIGGRATAMVAKIKAERSSGIYSFDVTLAGIRS